MQIQAMKLQSIFVLFTMAINVVNYFDPAYVKSDQIAKKNQKISFSVASKIKFIFLHRKYKKLFY